MLAQSTQFLWWGGKLMQWTDWMVRWRTRHCIAIIRYTQFGFLRARIRIDDNQDK